MGIGPVYAIPKVSKRVGLLSNQVDLFEINEAFASMYVYCLKNLKLDREKVNVNGGAIALGRRPERDRSQPVSTSSGGGRERSS